MKLTLSMDIHTLNDAIANEACHYDHAA